jgi:glycosyltransferase involved in cell wall biosynthesis
MSIKVVQIIDNLIIGGAQKLLVTLAGEARAHGLELTVVSLSAAQDRAILDDLAELGVKVTVFSAPHLLDFKRLIHLRRFMASRGFDLVQCHLTYANILGTLCARSLGLPVVTTLHSTVDELRSFHPMIGALEIWSLRYLAKRVLAVGYTIANSFRARLGGREIDVIPNAVPLPVSLSAEERLALRQGLAGEARREMLIGVGRFAPPKGFADLIAAIARLVPSHPNILLLLAGDGPLFGEIRDLVALLGLEKNVLLLGARRDVPRLLAASDLYVSSSHWEGLPLALLEAMMAGLPVVATHVGDMPRLVTAESGRIVPPRQPEALAVAIEQLLSDPARMRAMGASARALALRDYSPQAWMEKLLNLYRELLS